MKTPEELRSEFTSITHYGNVQDFEFVYADVDQEHQEDRDVFYYPLSVLKDSWESENMNYYQQVTLLDLANREYKYDLDSVNSGTMRFKVFTSGLVIEEETETELHTAFTLRLERIA